MNINNPINGTFEMQRNYILDVTPAQGKQSVIGPMPGDVKYSIVLGGSNSGNVFGISPKVLKSEDKWPTIP